MAYVSQELKAKISPRVKAILKKYGTKGSLAVRDHSTLVLNIASGEIDFVSNYNDCAAASHPQGREVRDGHIQVNPYHYDRYFAGRALAFMEEIFAAMNEGNYDESDSQTDYFSVGWYVNVNVGKWNKAYTVTA